MEVEDEEEEEDCFLLDFNEDFFVFLPVVFFCFLDFLPVDFVEDFLCLLRLDVLSRTMPLAKSRSCSVENGEDKENEKRKK